MTIWDLLVDGADTGAEDTERFIVEPGGTCEEFSSDEEPVLSMERS